MDGKAYIYTFFSSETKMTLGSKVTKLSGDQQSTVKKKRKKHKRCKKRVVNLSITYMLYNKYSIILNKINKSSDEA